MKTNLIELPVEFLPNALHMRTVGGTSTFTLADGRVVEICISSTCGFGGVSLIAEFSIKGQGWVNVVLNGRDLAELTLEKAIAILNAQPKNEV